MGETSDNRRETLKRLLDLYSGKEKTRIISLYSELTSLKKNQIKETYSIMIYTDIYIGGARGVMVIVLGIGHDDTSSNPGREWLHFT